MVKLFDIYCRKALSKFNKLFLIPGASNLSIYLTKYIALFSIKELTFKMEEFLRTGAFR